MIEPAPSLTRHALIPLSLVGGFALIYLAHAPAWTVLVLGAGISGLYLAAPRWGARSVERFDREALAAMSRGRASSVRTPWAMRLFAPPAVVAEREGRVAAELGRHELAYEAFLRASEGYPEGRAPLSIRIGFAHASHSLGRDAQAVAAYRALLPGASGLPRVGRNLAHSLARLGTDLDEAEQLVDRALATAPDDPELMLVRALVHARKGERSTARRLLKRARKSAPPSLRLEVERALD